MAVLLAGYAILDGFDLGAGILHPLAKTDEDRRVTLNAIGPVWDGNEVWLVTFGGALFAAFPRAYATLFSGLYTAFMLLLLCLILRALSLEFRGQRESKTWRSVWDIVFFGASFGTVLLFGVAAGNSLQGFPLGADGEIRLGFFDLLTPFPLMVGLFTVVGATLHGALYLLLKTDGAWQQKLRTWAKGMFWVFSFSLVAVTLWTLKTVPLALENLSKHPWAWAFVVVNGLSVVNIRWALARGKHLTSFLSSGVSLATLAALFGLALFPNVVVSNLDPLYNLTITNAASSQKTLQVMSVIALIGMPLVLTYSVIVYRIFRGKVKIGPTSY